MKKLKDTEDIGIVVETPLAAAVILLNVAAASPVAHVEAVDNRKAFVSWEEANEYLNSRYGYDTIIEERELSRADIEDLKVFYDYGTEDDKFMLVSISSIQSFVKILDSTKICIFTVIFMRLKDFIHANITPDTSLLNVIQYYTFKKMISQKFRVFFKKITCLLIV